METKNMDRATVLLKGEERELTIDNVVKTDVDEGVIMFTTDIGSTWIFPLAGIYYTINENQGNLDDNEQRS